MRARKTKPSGEPGPSLAGSLLLAHPGLVDPNFARSVVLISEHDGEGAMGVVFNRPSGRTMGELDPAFALGPLAEVPIFTGGPVQTERLLICAWRVQPEAEAGFQLHFGIEPARAANLLKQPGMHVRAFAGYAGWSAGQLEAELAKEAWAVSMIPENLMDFAHDEDLWRGVLSEINHVWRVLAEEPEDPSAN